jgi:hypothetical protein
MPRSLSAAVLAAIAAKTVRVALFAQLSFRDNTLYLFSGVGTITPSGPPASTTSSFPYGQTFTGLGWLARLSAVPQTTKIQAQNITLSLSGVPPSLVGEAVFQVRIDGTVTVWIGFFDANGNMLTDPAQLFYGAMDVPSLADAGETSTISLSCENSLLSLNLAPNRRFDDPDQQLYFPGDLGMSFVQALENIQLFWPAFNNVGSPYPVSISMSPSSVILAVGASTTLQVTIHYSNGTTYTVPPATGAGPAFVLCMASTNPRIATFQYTVTNNVTGVAPGECSIMARIPGPGGGGVATVYRAVCTVFVHP